MKVFREGYNDWFYRIDGSVAPLEVAPAQILRLEIILKKAIPPQH
jgi:hypothetical protein